jgi:tripeptidyl-peptidase-2
VCVGCGVGTMADTTTTLSRQMPKEEIGATDFLRQHPESDGRGVLVAVFDTGCDPGADGLLVTPDGRPKMLDVIDCTGAGDVDTSHAAAVSADGTLTGLSGRALKVPAEWPAIKPDAKYQLGLKYAFELYPHGLAARVKKERRKKLDAAQRDAVAACRAALADNKPDANNKKWTDELTSRATLLEQLDKDYDDPGPLYDVLTYPDTDGMWRVCLDTSECGDLASCTL